MQRWQADCLKKLLALDNVQMVLLIIDDQNRKSRSKHSIGQWLDKLLFKSQSTETEYADPTEMFPAVPSVRCKHFSAGVIKAIKSHQLDFILKLEYGELGGEVLNTARYGIWSFEHCVGEKFKDAPAGFWEMYTGNDVTEVSLLRLTGQTGAGVVLKKGFFKTICTSYARQADQILFGSAGWPARVCADILNETAEYLNAPPSPIKASPRHAPGGLQKLLFLGKLWKNRIVDKYRLLFRHEQWNIGVVARPIHSFLETDSGYHADYLPPPPKGSYAADPFGLMTGNKLTILYEHFDYKAYKGMIAYTEMESSPPRSGTVMEMPGHMSYPYMFTYKGEIYCLPETGYAREASIYRALQFPCKWEKAATLLENTAAVDSTVFRYQGLWWLTCTLLDQNPFTNLFIWYAEDLFGLWKPHAANPVKTDIRSARPGGTPFWHNGRLYRPAQDCSKTYGGRIVINRVIKLTPAAFQEEQAAVVEPPENSPFPEGLHTLSAVGQLTLIDGKRYVFVGDRFSSLWRKGLAKVYKPLHKN